MTLKVMANAMDEADTVTKMGNTNWDVNGFNIDYNFKSNNCHCVSTAYLTKLGITVPGSITIAPSATVSIGINQGWGKMPVGY